jgi:basic amino acid/polyamine antiporter, APA family
MEQPNNNNSGLVQSFGLFTLIMIVLSSMIGSGVFKKIAQMSAHVQSPKLVMLAWVLAGLVSLFGALGNAEVGSMITEPGGQYAYFKHMYGRFVAFMYGWTMFSVVQTATAAAVAIVFAQATADICAVSGNPLSDMAVTGLGLSAIAIFTFVNYRGAELSGSVNTVFMALIVTALVGIIIADLTIGGGSMANIMHSADANSINETLRLACTNAGIDITGLNSMEELQANLAAMQKAAADAPTGAVAAQLEAFGKVANLNNMEHLAAGSEAVTSTTSGFLKAMFAAMLGAFWAYEGWNNVGYLGGEVKNPQRNIPLGLTVGVVVVMAIYTLINFSYLYVMPIEKLIGVHLQVGKIGAVEVLKTYMTNGVIVVSAIIALANFNTTNNSILASPRVTYAMATDGLFFKPFADIHPVYKTPTLAILAMGVMSALFVLSGQFDALTDMLVFASFIFYFMAAVGVFVLRKKMPDTPRGYRTPLLFPAIFAIFSFFLVIFTIYNDPLNAAKGLGLMALGLPLYFYLEKDKTNNA